MHRLGGIELGDDRNPDETTILNFRHLLERHAPGPGDSADGDGLNAFQSPGPSVRCSVPACEAGRGSGRPSVQVAGRKQAVGA